MKKGLIALTAVSCMFISNMGGAGQLTTDFAYNVKIGEVVTNAHPTPAGYQLTLPSDLSNWDCSITAAFISKDGKQVYHNIACTDTISHVTVGTGINCHTQQEDMSEGQFFMRTSSGTDVSFYGGCLTHPVEARPALVPQSHAGATL